MAALSKNVYINKWINQLKNTTAHVKGHQMKPADVKVDTFTDFDVEKNDKDLKFNIGEHMRISKYKNTFAKGNMPNQSEEVFMIKNDKNTIPWTHVIEDLKDEEVVGTFYEEELQNTNQTKFIIEKVLRRKDLRMYIKWRGHFIRDNSLTRDNQ